MLTKRQKQILDFINAQIEKHGVAPTLEEMARHFRLASASTVHEHLEALEKKGFLKKKHGQARAISTKHEGGLVRVPLLGSIAAGQPIQELRHNEYIAVPQSLVPSGANVYALKVLGDSMIEENIHDGDTILVRHQETAENGQKVVALLDNFGATLKKFYREHGQIRLQPANKNIEPIIVRNGRDVSIQGIVLGVIPNSEIVTNNEDSKTTLLKLYYETPKFKLYQANCLDLLASLPENSVDMVFADPPYNLSNGGITVHAGRMVSVNKGDWDKSNGLKKDFEFHLAWIEAARRVLKPHGTTWISGTYHSIYQCGFALQVAKFHILNDIAWFKPNASPNLSCRYFTASHET